MERKEKRKNIVEKNLKEATNSDYYSQEKKFNDTENSYIDYVARNVLPYND